MRKIHLSIILLALSAGLLLVWLGLDEPLNTEAAAWLDEVNSSHNPQRQPSEDELYLIGMHSISRNPVTLGKAIHEDTWAEQADALPTLDRNELVKLLDCRDPDEERCQAIPRLLEEQQALLSNYENWDPKGMPIPSQHVLRGAELWFAAELLSMLDVLWQLIGDDENLCEECLYAPLIQKSDMIPAIENNINFMIWVVLFNRRLDFILKLAAEDMISLDIEQLHNLAIPLNEHGLDPKSIAIREYSKEVEIVRFSDENRTEFMEGSGIFWYWEQVQIKRNASINYLHEAYLDHLCWIDPACYIRHADPDQLPSDVEQLPLRNRRFFELTGGRPASMLHHLLGQYHGQNARLTLLSHQLRGLQGHTDWEEDAARDNPFGDVYRLVTEEHGSQICYEEPSWLEQDIRCIPRVAN